MQPAARRWTGIAIALGSAGLFGASTPLAKMLLSDVAPWLMAGLLYLGMGIGLWLVRRISRLAHRAPREAPLRRADMGWLAAVILSGGILAPVLLMVGLNNTDASTAALLLNTESLATLLIAWLVYRENVDLRVGIGAMAILAGAALLTFEGTALRLNAAAVAIIGACLCWGIDNNLTRRLSASDPLQIAMLKGLVAGSVSLLLAVSTGAHFPVPAVVLGVMGIGLIGYGISLVMFIYALRYLGTARTGAYFSLAPFIGAAMAVTIFDEALTWQLAVAAGLMALGLLLHLTERHDHLHSHEALFHEHAHTHDDHHRHEHAADAPPGEPHVHWHSHPPLTHRHPHYPDIHHRHPHHQA